MSSLLEDYTAYKQYSLLLADMLISKYLKKVRKVLSIGSGSDDLYEKLVANVKIYLPNAVIKADLETKTVMVSCLIK
jgi:hypothetical protein